MEEPLARGDFSEAAELCDGDPRAVSQFALIAIKNREIGYAKIKHLVMDRFQRDVLSDLEQRLSWVNTVIKSAPMVGLFGTVMGMMGAFGKLANAAKRESRCAGRRHQFCPDHHRLRVGDRHSADALDRLDQHSNSQDGGSGRRRIEPGPGHVPRRDDAVLLPQWPFRLDGYLVDATSATDQQEYFVEAGEEHPLVFRRPLEDAEMDITPMIDITFLLLIFFLVASRLDEDAPVELPTARYGAPWPRRVPFRSPWRRATAEHAEVYLADGRASDRQIAVIRLTVQEQEIIALCRSRSARKGSCTC